VQLDLAGKTRSAPAVPKEDGAVVPRLSVLVLPFANLSNDPEQEYFADGLPVPYSSKKEKCEKRQTCSYNAEAKNEYCVERWMAGQCTILHGQISLVTVLRAHYVQLTICE
jgi:hypothetical protein